MVNFKKTRIPLFRRFVLQNFPFIEQDFDALTDYELICKVVEYLNKVILSTNANSEQVEILTSAFNELQSYVDHYFDNLDVQEEINNKLDQMAEDGTLTELILNYYSKTVDAIFPTYGIDGNDTLGDCSIIKTPTKTIMIDTFVNSADTFYAIQQALTENDIDKIDILLITHYHVDHYGNYQRLINSGLINNARIILPKAVTVNGVAYNGSDIKEALTLAGLEWEEAENETIEVDDYTSMRLFNTSDSDYEYYLANSTNYNDYCICTEIKCFNKKMLFTADCAMTACKYITTYYITESNYDLLKEPHHGLTDFSVEFPKKVCPKNVLVSASMGMVKKNLARSGTLLNAWGLYTSSIYFQGGQNKPVKFTFTRENTTVDASVFSVQEPGSGGNWNYYVDSTTTDELRTGSQEHPFKNLAEASVMLPKNSNADIVVNVVSLGSETDTVLFRGYKNLTVDFNSHAPAHSIEFRDSEYIKIIDTSLSTTDIKIQRCSNVYVQNFASEANTTQLTIEMCSKVTIGGTVTSTNANPYVFRLTHSNVSFDISSFNYTPTESGKIFNGWGNNVNFNSAFLTSLTQYSLNNQIWSISALVQNNVSNLETLGVLFSSESATYSAITLRESLSNYKKMRIYCVTGTNEPTKVIEVPITNPTGNNYCVASFPILSGNLQTIYNKTCRINGNKTDVTIDRNAQVTSSANANPATASVAEGNYVGIVKIVGVIE